MGIMTIQFEIEERTNYIYLSCTGVYGEESLLKVLEAGFDITEKKGLIGLLVDVRKLIGSPPSVAERFEIGELITVMQLQHSSRICLAVVGNEPIVDPKRFAQTVAANRGATLKVFTDIAEAVFWVEEWIKRRGTDLSHGA